MWGQSASTLNYYAQYKTGHQINASLGDGSFLSFINTTFRSVFKESLPISHSLKSPECRACSDIATRGHCYFVVIVFQLFHDNIEWGRCVQLKAQKLQRSEVGKTWTNPFFFFLPSAAGGLTPGQTLQRSDLSSAMETSTNPVAFVSTQKKMPQINLAVGIHLLLRLKTSSKACETARGSRGFM